ncbi:hypothetical protein D3C72_1387010 [compost metagenome]
MRIWRRQRTSPSPTPETPAETRPEGATEPAVEPSTEQVLEAGPTGLCGSGRDMRTGPEVRRH